jgi:hypothetical protein
MKIVDSLYPFCFPTDLKIDVPELIQSIGVLLKRLKLSFEFVNGHNKFVRSFSINLTHLPNLKGVDRWKKYTGRHPDVRSLGVAERDFSEHLEESQDLLIGHLVHEIYKQHNGKFQGRAQLVWLSPGNFFDFHKDFHTPNRYHVPIFTNEKCYWLFQGNTDIYQLHMPADGRVWYLDPIGVSHAFYNKSNTPRLHLLCTSGF